MGFIIKTSIFFIIILFIINGFAIYYRLKPKIIAIINSLIFASLIYILVKKPFNTFIEELKPDVFNNITDFILNLIT